MRLVCVTIFQWKAISVTYSVCVSLVLFIQYAKRMRRIIVSSMACLAVSYFFTCSYKWHDIREKKLLKVKCVSIFSTSFSETFLFLRRNQRDIIINVPRFSSNVPIILTRF